MKKVSLILMLLLAGMAGFAQQQKPPKMPKPKMVPSEQRAQRAVDRLDSIVKLTADQKPKVYALALTKVQKMDAIREKYKGQKEKHKEMRAEAEPVRKAYRDGVKALLTPDQIKKVREHRQKMKPNKPAGPGGKKPGPPPGDDDDDLPDTDGK